MSSDSSLYTAPGYICSATELAFASPNNGTNYDLTCLSRGQSIGLSMIAETGLISLIAVTLIFILILRKVIQTRQLITRPTDVYMLSLFTFDILYAIGRVTHIKWIAEGKLYSGGYCTAQGVTQQIGETGVAMATLAIAIHTFIVVMWGKLRHQINVAYYVVGFTWLFVILFVGIGTGIHTKGSEHYMTPDGFWCWIGNGPELYKKERIAGEYFELSAAMFISFIAYIPLFFWARGNITIDRVHWWKVDFHSATDIEGNDKDGRKRRAFGMIAYPLAYAIMVLPMVVCRFISKFGSDAKKVPSRITFVVEALFSLSGAVNASLFIFTRSELLGLGNKSGKKHKLGFAPEVTPSEMRLRVNDMDSMRTRSTRQNVAGDVGLLPVSDEGGWALPVLEDDDDPKESELNRV